MLKRLLAALVLLTAFGTLPSRAEPFATQASNAILVDIGSGAVLMEKNADIAVPPASMSKLMTVRMVFEALASGRLTLEDEFVVSEKAWKMGGSKMFVKVGDRISIGNLLRGIIVQSGNDACIVIAEGLAGSEAEFARRMTQRAPELGLKNSQFANATGWPDEGHEMSVRDLATLAQRHIEDFPELYKIYSERSFTWEGITQNNRNPLLSLDLGADGMKTGHTEEAGYGLVGSAEQDGRRLVVVVTGLPNSSERAIEAERILRWGFREFESLTLLAPGREVGTAPVWIGAEDRVPLVVKDAVKMTTPFGAASKITAEVVVDGPVEAPIEKGDELGVLRISAPNVAPIEAPVFAGKSVARGGLTDKLKAGAMLLIDNALTAATAEGTPAGTAQ